MLTNAIANCMQVSQLSFVPYFTAVTRPKIALVVGRADAAGVFRGFSASNECSQRCLKHYQLFTNAIVNCM